MTIKNEQIIDAPKVESATTPPSTGSSKGAFYEKEVTGVTEGFHVDDTGQEVQITDNGVLKGIPADTDDVAEGASNLYYTDGRVSAHPDVRPLCSQIEAEAGVDNTKSMSPLRTAQAIAALAGGAIPIMTLDEGAPIDPAAVSYDFVGAGVTASVGGPPGAITVTIPGGGGTPLAIFDGGAPVDPDVNMIDFVGATIVPLAPGAVQVIIPGGAGEVNDGTNVGGEKEVFKDKSGLDLRFRTLKEGANITLTQNADDIEIAAAGGGGGGTTAEIKIPAAGSLLARLAAATGIPVGWSLVLGSDPSVDPGFTTLGAGAGDVVIIHDEGKSADLVVHKDFGGLVQQEAIFDPTGGETFQNNTFTQILLKDFIAKVAAPEATILILMA